jgi:cytoskeletal protein RodZ
MQHLDNDMDDLFQRAAENYPLRVDNGDWESIAIKIADAPTPSNVIIAPAKKGNKRIIVLALLLFIVSFGWYIFQRPSHRINRRNNNELTKNKDNTPGKSEIKTDYPGAKNEARENDISDQNTSRNKRGLSSSAVIEIKPINIITSDTFAYTSKIPRQDISERNMPTEKPGIVYNNYYAYFLSAEDFSKQENQKLIEGSKNNVETSLVPIRKYIPLSKDVSIVEENSANVSLKKKPSAQDKRGLYFGLIAGPDLSKVHSRPFNFGFDAGLLFGYKINSKISLETGLIKGRKNYTSDGSNFNMAKISQSMPAGMTINDLASKSNLIEISLKVKYSFMTKKNSGFFVSGGLSSYIMTMEKNLYNTSVNGNPEKFNGVYYKNNYRFPADATISAGYEHSISNNLDFKIEPFLKIPLQGVGVGSLPVTSTGLQVGITRKLK